MHVAAVDIESVSGPLLALAAFALIYAGLRRRAQRSGRPLESPAREAMWLAAIVACAAVAWLVGGLAR